MADCPKQLTRQLLQNRLLLGGLTWSLFLVVSISAQYRFDSWTTENGLPQASINSILQTRDGFLWLTTFGGLVRYDGLRFQVFNTGNTEGLKTSRFTLMMEGRDGALWISTEKQGVTCYRDGKFTSYTSMASLPAEAQNMAGENSRGIPFLRNEESVSYPSGYGLAAAPPQPGEPTQNVLLKTAAGAIWYLDQNSHLRKYERGQLTVDFAPDFKILRIFEDAEQRLWMAANDDKNQLLMLKDGQLTTYSEKDGYPKLRFLSAAEDAKGNIFFTTAGSGLVRFKDGKFTVYTMAEGLVSNAGTDIYVDREDTIWVGTAGGLSRLTERMLATYSARDGLAADNVYPIYQDRAGKIWIGSWNGLTIYENGTFRNAGEAYGVGNRLFTALAEDRAGNFWLGTWSGDLQRLRDGIVKTYTPPETAGSAIRAIFEDSRGNFWLGTGGSGLVLFKDDKFISVTSNNSGGSSSGSLPGKEIYVIYEDRSHQIWFGSDAGLTVYRADSEGGGGTFASFSEKDGFPATALVRAIYEDSDRTLWVGTYDGGLYRYRDNRFTRYTTREGLYDNGVFQIIEDGRGNFWISCNLGIYRVRKSELNDYAEGRARQIASIPYNQRDGMLNSECNGGVQPAGIRAADGRIWFPTQKGVAVIDPEAVPFNSQPPPVVVESVVVDTALVEPNAVEIQPGQTNLEIHYSGLSFINPELVKFKYQMENLDAGWVDAGTRRTAYYSHLPPGHYRFRVLAANRDNVWNEQGASIEITVLAAFWQTWWFRCGLLLAIFAAVFAFYRWRIGMLRRAAGLRETFARQLIESQEDERKRIAVELHDSLGQSLVLIKNWALLGIKGGTGSNGTNGNSSTGGDKNVSQERLSEISEMASEAIQEVREIAYNLGPYQLERLGLKKSIEEMIDKVAASTAVNFKTEIDEIEGYFTRQSEINIFRIIQEAINNIVKHSEAAAAEISLRAGASGAELIVRDNGKGFNRESSTGDGSRSGGKDDSKPGFGLVGMSERVHLVKGAYKIESEPGRGTTITVQLPYERVFNKS